MKTQGIAKRIMAFVVSLMLTLSALPAELVSADPTEASITLKAEKEFTKEKVKLTATVSEGVQESTVEFYQGETKLEGQVITNGNKISITIDKDNGVYNYYAKAKTNDDEEIKSATQRVIVDKEKPQINNISLNPLPGESGYSDSDVTVTFDAIDNGDSGLDKVVYSTDRVNYKSADKTPDGKYTFTAEKSGKYYIKAVDKAGNESDEIQPIEIKIDKEKPEIDVTVDPLSNNYSKKDGIIYVSASDRENDSGIEKVYYSINDESEQEAKKVGDNKYEIIVNVGGKYKIWAVDKAKKESDKVTQEIKFDTEAPTISDIKLTDKDEIINAGDYNNNNTVLKGDVTVSFKVEDNQSGVKEVTCTHNGQSVAVKNEDGKYSFVANSSGEYVITATDNIDNNNSSNPEKIKIKLDNQKPVLEVSAKCGDKDFDLNDWAYGDVKVTLKATDKPDGENSGIKSVYYGTEKIEGEVDEEKLKLNKSYTCIKPSEENTDQFKFTEEGEKNSKSEKTYYCYAVDNGGYISEVKSFTVKIDRRIIDIDIDNISVARASGCELADVISGLLDMNGIVEKKLENAVDYIANNKLEVSFKVERDGDKEPTISVKDEAGNSIECKEKEEHPGYYSFIVPKTITGNGKIEIPEVIVTAAFSDTNKTISKECGKFTISTIKPNIKAERTCDGEEAKVKVSASVGLYSPEGVKIKKLFYVYAKEKPTAAKIISNDNKVEINDSKNGENIDFSGINGENIYLCAVDNIGNVSEVTEIKDSSAPSITRCTIDGNKISEGWYNKKITLKLDINDEKKDGETQSGLYVNYWTGSNKSDIKTLKLKVKYDKDKLNKTEQFVELPLEDDQNETYHFQPCDNAGNDGEIFDVNIKIDRTLPEIKEVKASASGMTNENVTVEVTAEDLENNNVASGIKEVVAISSDNQEIQPVKSNSETKKYEFVFSKSQNKEYRFKVTDNAGNSSTYKNKINIKIDKTKPVVKSATPPKSDLTRNDVTVKVIAYDPQTDGLASGIKYVKAVPINDSVGGKEIIVEKSTPVENNSNEKEFVFTFSGTQKAKYKFIAVDNFNQESENDITADVKIDQTKPEFKSIKSNHEGEITKDDVVIDVTVFDSDEIEVTDPETNKPVRKKVIASGIQSVTATPINSKVEKPITLTNGQNGVYSFTFKNTQCTEYKFTVKDNVGNERESEQTSLVWIDKKEPKITDITSTSENTFTNKEVIVRVKATDPEENGVSSGVKQITAIPVSGGVGGKEAVVSKPTDGVYVFKFNDTQNTQYRFVVEDNVGNKSEYGKTTTVKIDKTKPIAEVTKIEDTSEYSFGIFSTEEKGIKITINARDLQFNNVASNVAEVRMISSDSDGKVVSDTLKANDKGEYVFTIPSVIAKNTYVLNKLYNDVSFIVKDNAGNESDKKTLGELLKERKVSSNALVDNKKPLISSFTFPTPQYIDKQGRRWFNTSEVTANVTVSDIADTNKDASGIESAYLSTATKTSSYTIKQTDKSALHTYDLSLTSQAKDVKNNGELKFSAKVTDIAKNSFSTSDQKDRNDTVYVDTKAPEITDITVNNNSIVGNYLEYATAAFSTTERTVRINAVDVAGNNTGASGVDKITYKLYDINNNTETEHTVKVIDGSYISFTISPNFKGYIKAYAVDCVGNKSADVLTKRLVVENETMHTSTSNISISIPETAFKDNDGRKLYPNNIDATINVSDTYSGIKNVEYTLGTDWHTLSGMKVTSKDSNINTAQASILPIGENRNNIVLKIRLTDNAGNQSVKEINFSIDKTVPTIRVSYDNNNYNRAYTETQYFKAERTATVTVKERNFNENDLRAAITASAGTTPVVSSFVTHPNTANPDETTHTATIRFVQDADYTLALDFTDRAGHAATKYGVDKFTIDKTAPTTNVTLSSSPKNGKYYSDKQTVTVQITEHNFDKNLVNINASQGTIPDKNTWQWSDSGDVHTATFVLNKDDEYAFNVNVADKAVNNANVFNQSQFVIDQTKPDALITDVEHGKAYGETPEIHPSIQGKDVNLSTVTYKIIKKLRDGSEKDVTKDFAITSVESAEGNKKVLSYRGMSFDHTESFDGIYTIEATVTDLAGNVTPILETFSINRFGANFTIDDQTIKDEVLNKYLREGRDIKIKAINVNPISSDKVEITLVCNGEERKLDRSDYRIVENHTEGGWYEYEYIISKEVFKNDGSYSLRISASDEAGNVSKSNDDAHNEKIGDIAFFIDSIKPSVAITGADNKQSYKEQSKEITVKFEDANIDTEDYKDSIHVLVNGKELNPDDYKEVESETGAGVVTIKFDVTDSDAEVVAYCFDLAKNESDHEKLVFKLDQNWLQRFYNNQKGAFFATVGGIIAVIAAIVFFIIKKKRNR